MVKLFRMQCMAFMTVFVLSGCTVAVTPNQPYPMVAETKSEPAPPPVVNVTTPEQPTPVVNVAAPNVEIRDLKVDVHLPKEVSTYASIFDYERNQDRINLLYNELEQLGIRVAALESNQAAVHYQCEKPMRYFSEMPLGDGSNDAVNEKNIKQAIIFQKMIRECMESK